MMDVFTEHPELGDDLQCQFPAIAYADEIELSDTATATASASLENPRMCGSGRHLDSLKTFSIKVDGLVKS
jgi:hypothetical protein